MIQVWCIKCRKELDKPGALVFSPPPDAQDQQDRQQLTIKYHVCDECFQFILRWFGLVK